MRKSLILFFLTLILLQTKAQERILLDTVEWQFEIPEDYKIANQEQFEQANTPTVLFLYKTDEHAANTFKAEFFENDNLNKLTAAVYAFTLEDDFKKRFNNDDFDADVKLEPMKISDKNFYHIRTFLTDKSNGSNYIYDYWFTELDGKEFAVTLFCDNDEDKELLRNILLNSKFL